MQHWTYLTTQWVVLPSFSPSSSFISSPPISAIMRKKRERGEKPPFEVNHIQPSPLFPFLENLAKLKTERGLSLLHHFHFDFYFLNNFQHSADDAIRTKNDKKKPFCLFLIISACLGNMNVEPVWHKYVIKSKLLKKESQISIKCTVFWNG